MTGYATANPFALLGNKKVRQEPRDHRGGEKKTPTQTKDGVKTTTKKEVKAARKEEPKREAKIVSLAAATKKTEEKEAAKAAVKAEEVAAKVQKATNAKHDKQDRTGKAHQVRKEGKGPGGWEDNRPLEATATEDVDAEEKKAKKEEKSEEELAADKARLEEEAKLREIEEKQMTLDEYKKKQLEDGPVVEARAARVVDDSAFKGMSVKGRSDTGIFQIGKKDAKKTVAKKEVKEKVKLDVGFRLDAPVRAGKGKGEGKGGKGKGGRGGYQSRQSEPEVPAVAVDDEALFPSLGGPAKAQPAEEATA